MNETRPPQSYAATRSSFLETAKQSALLRRELAHRAAYPSLSQLRLLETAKQSALLRRELAHRASQIDLTRPWHQQITIRD